MPRVLYSAAHILLLIISHAFAQWELLDGPDGDQVNDLVVCQNDLFAGTNNGIYRASLVDKRWECVTGDSLRKKFPNMAACDTILFAASNAMLYRSTDNGRNWNHVYTAEHQIHEIAVIDTFLVIGTGNSYGSGGRGVYRMSVNDTVLQSASGIEDEQARSFAVRDSIILAGCSGNVYISRDKGLTWHRHRESLGGTAILPALTFCDTSILVGSAYGLFTSSLESDNWTEIADSIDNLGVSAIFVEGQTIVIGRRIMRIITLSAEGVARSFDGGITWDTNYNGLPERTAVSCFVKQGSILYAGTNYGVFYSMDQGLNWEAMNDGLRTKTITSLAGFNGEIFVGTKQGIYSSADNGNTWQERFDGLRVPIIHCLRAEGKYLLAGTNGSGLQWWDPEDEKWFSRRLDYSYMALEYITDIARHGDFILAQTKRDGITCAPVDRYSSWARNLSFDEGGCLGQYGNTVIASVEGKGTFLCDSVNSREISYWHLRSTDEFSTFLEKNQTLYAGNASGIFVSLDTGRTWNTISAGLESRKSKWTNTLSSAGERVFAGTLAGVYVLDDTSGCWNNVGAGLPDSVSVRTIMANDDYLFAGTEGYGLWRRPREQVVAIKKNKNMIAHPNTSFDISHLNGVIKVRVIGKPVKHFRIDLFTSHGKRVLTQWHENANEACIITKPLASGMYTCKISIAGRMQFSRVAVVR